MSRITKIGIPSGGTTSQVLVKNSNTDYDVTWGTGGGGGITGSGVANEITYWTGTSAVGSLSTATYPSLTELSYVKGVTSSIQTQLNGKQNTLTNPVTGTGTSGYVTFWSGTSTVTGEANLFWDATNDRLGIGTSSPSFPLDVNGTARTGTITINTNGQGRTIGTYFGSGTNGSNIWIGGGGLSSQINTSPALATDGSNNVSCGVNALFSNTIGDKNTAIGDQSLYSNTSGRSNTGVGERSLYTNSSGFYNSAFGSQALLNSTSDGNVAIGYGALFRLTSGQNNTAIGNAVSSNAITGTTTGSNNIFIGYLVNGTSATDSNKIYIGNSSNTDNYIAGNFNITDAKNFILGTTTGTKFGTSTSQKIGFFNATPVVQPSAVTSAQGIADALTSLGLLASSTISGGGSTYSISTKTTTYNETATSGDIILLGDTTTAGFTITLPSAVSNTAKITIKKIAGTNNLTIDGNGSQTIDGGLTAVLVRVYESVTLVSDNSNWHII